MVNEGLSKTGTNGVSEKVVSCFLVTPFGKESEESSDEARIFGEVEALKNHVFKRVTAEFADGDDPIKLEIQDAREYDDPDRDMIRDKVIERIDNSDLVIVVMTAHDKPNAFIEYGWATALWKKPIVLRRDGFELPTNINNAFAFDYDPVKLVDETSDHASTLAKQIKSRIEAELNLYRRRVPFNHLPKTMLSHGTVDVLGRFQNVSIEEWSETLLNAKSEIIIASRALYQILGQPFYDANGTKTKIQPLLQDIALRGVKVTVVLQHADNVTSDHLRLKSEDKSEAMIREEQDIATKKWFTTKRIFNQNRISGEMDVPEDGFRVVLLHDRFLPFRATLTDQKLYLTLRFYTQEFNSGLCLVTEPGPKKQDPDNPSVYSQIHEELQFLISENLERSEESYQQWLKDTG